MWRIIGFLLVVGGIFGLSQEVLNNQIPKWKSTTISLVQEAQNAQLDRDAWKELNVRVREELPWFYPFSRMRSLFAEGEYMVHLVHEAQHNFSINFSFEDRTMSTRDLEKVFWFLAQTEVSIDNILYDLRALPTWLLEPEELKIFQSQVAWLEYLQDQLQDAQRFEKIFQRFVKDKERVLILLQNQNEPRSTGGFAGSLVLLDFDKDKITWEFLDIYALDRLVPGEVQPAAPAFFHDLSKTISLRDANFWPDFRQSAQSYRFFFDAIGERPPKTVVGINLNSIEEVLKLTGPVTLDKWGLELNQHNFDTMLQFLVESKITGRYNVKAPVEIFGSQLFSPESMARISWQDWQRFNLKAFLQAKNILAHSQNIQLQKLFEKWGIDGQIRPKGDADNFIHFDFISIGANKSEKFMWTKLHHDSEILSDGRVLNTLDIKRTHALRAGELNDLLGTNTMPPNVKDLITEDLWWKLGAGQNRTIMRVWVPAGSQLVDQVNPSGGINVNTDFEGFTVFEIPLFVVPSETVNVTLKYQTQIDRGASNWRPYFLELLGTPGKDKTAFIASISTGSKGAFSAETQNIGKPQDLVDSDFRAVVEFEN